MDSTTDIHRGSVDCDDLDPRPPDPEVEDRARISWERRAEWPLTVAAVIFLVAYAWPILDPSVAPSVARVFDVTVWVTWWLFAIDYAVRLILARERWRFVRGSFLDLITVVLPVLRPLRLLRLLTVLSVLNRYAGQSLRGRVALYVAGSVGMTIVVASLAVLEAERGSDDANIRSVGDALWWAVTTMTTVGYGDQYPVTATGRLVAVGLMLTGIALIGVVTASLASWLLDRVKAVEQTSQVATATDIAVIAAELAALRAELAEVRRREGVQGLASGGALPSIETHVAQKSALESERPSSGPE